MSKNFIDEIQKFEQKLRFAEPFAFSRYSDGEMFILQKKELLHDNQKIIIGDKQIPYTYPEENHKHYIPEKHDIQRKLLKKSFLFEKDNYYKGIISSNVIAEGNEEQYKFQFEVLNKTKQEVDKDEYFTFADLFVNGNYPYFLEHLLPYFFNYDTFMICSDKANVDNLPFNVKKSFRTRKNCFIEQQDIFIDIRDYIETNNISNSLFLFSASSLSEVLIHRLFEFNDKNTYLDVGTCLNIFMGIDIDRNYLRGFWLNSGEPDIQKINVW